MSQTLAVSKIKERSTSENVGMMALATDAVMDALELQFQQEQDEVQRGGCLYTEEVRMDMKTKDHKVCTSPSSHSSSPASEEGSEQDLSCGEKSSLESTPQATTRWSSVPLQSHYRPDMETRLQEEEKKEADNEDSSCWCLSKFWKNIGAYEEWIKTELLPNRPLKASSTIYRGDNPASVMHQKQNVCKEKKDLLTNFVEQQTKLNQYGGIEVVVAGEMKNGKSTMANNKLTPVTLTHVVKTSNQQQTENFTSSQQVLNKTNLKDEAKQEVVAFSYPKARVMGALTTALEFEVKSLQKMLKELGLWAQHVYELQIEVQVEEENELLQQHCHLPGKDEKLTGSISNHVFSFATEVMLSEEYSSLHRWLENEMDDLKRQLADTKTSYQGFMQDVLKALKPQPIPSSEANNTRQPAGENAVPVPSFPSLEIQSMFHRAQNIATNGMQFFSAWLPFSDGLCGSRHAMHALGQRVQSMLATSDLAVQSLQSVMHHQTQCFTGLSALLNAVVARGLGAVMVSGPQQYSMAILRDEELHLLQDFAQPQDRERLMQQETQKIGQTGKVIPVSMGAVNGKGEKIASWRQQRLSKTQHLWREKKNEGNVVEGERNAAKMQVTNTKNNKVINGLPTSPQTPTAATGGVWGQLPQQQPRNRGMVPQTCKALPKALQKRNNSQFSSSSNNGCNSGKGILTSSQDGVYAMTTSSSSNPHHHTLKKTNSYRMMSNKQAAIFSSAGVSSMQMQW